MGTFSGPKSLAVQIFFNALWAGLTNPCDISDSFTAVCEKVGTTRFGNKQNTPKPNLRVWLILGSSLGNWTISHHKKGLSLVK